MLNKYHFVGKLTLSSSIMSKMEYGIIAPSTHDITYISLTEIFEEIYYSPSPFIHISVSTNDNSFDTDRTGELFIERNSLGLFTWYINTYCLGDDLFNNTNKKINIIIEHLEEKEIKYKKVSEEAS